MLRNVFLKTLRDRWSSMLWYGGGLGLLGLWVILLYPTIGEAFAELFEGLPEAMRLLIGDIADLGTVEGFLGVELFSAVVPALLLILAIGFGGGSIVDEERQGSLDLLLSTPLLRRNLVIQKFAALVVILLLVTFVMWAVLVISALAADIEIGFVRLLEMSFSGVLLGLAFGAFALFVGCTTGRRGLALAVPAGIAVITYLLNGLGVMIDWLEPYRVLSPFYYYIAAEPLVNGLEPVHALVLAGLGAIFFAGALVTFERRDLAV